MPRNIHQRFGTRVRELRDARRITQERLSELSGIGREHISRIENGHREAGLEVISKLAKSLGITIAEMMEGV